MNNYVDILLPLAQWRDFEPLTWAKKHCPSYITNDAILKDGVYYYRFYFGVDRDRMMFILRWS